MPYVSSEGLHRVADSECLKQYSPQLREAVGSLAISVGNLTELLVAAREFEEAQSLAREKLPAIIDRHGPDHILTLEVRTWYARALFLEGEGPFGGPRESSRTFWRRSRRVLGDSHPDTERAREFLDEVRSARADARRSAWAKLAAPQYDRRAMQY